MNQKGCDQKSPKLERFSFLSHPLILPLLLPPPALVRRSHLLYHHLRPLGFFLTSLSVSLVFHLTTPLSHPLCIPVEMASQQNTPYLPIGAGEGHQDDPPADQSRNYSDDPPPVPERPQDSPFNPYELSADGPVEDGVPRPRFLGHAAGDGARGSFASSFGIPSTVNEADNSSSVYALNPLANRESAGYSSVPYQDDPHDSDFAAGALSPSRRNRYLEEKRDIYAPPSKSKRKFVIIAVAVGVVIVAIAVIVALYFTVIKKSGKTSNSLGDNNNGNNNNTNNNNDNNGKNNNTSSNILKSGGDGSTLHLDDGTNMTYSNPFGGTWYWDPKDPFNNNAQAQSWTPPLNQSFKWGTDRIFGFVPKPFLQHPVLIFACS